MNAVAFEQPQEQHNILPLIEHTRFTYLRPSVCIGAIYHFKELPSFMKHIS